MCSSAVILTNKIQTENRSCRGAESCTKSHRQNLLVNIMQTVITDSLSLHSGQTIIEKCIFIAKHKPASI